MVRKPRPLGRCAGAVASASNNGRITLSPPRARRYPPANQQWAGAGSCYHGGEASPQALADVLAATLGDQLRVRALLSASVLTQATDVECECDGLRNYDRSAKFSDAQAAQVRAAFERLIAGG